MTLPPACLLQAGLLQTSQLKTHTLKIELQAACLAGLFLANTA